ncbi:hypothetical protein G7Z17_g11163 [Cylindrodendrum hubeiense]|uniref:Extracellular membrane protein CFEM domain-containing protein n=1 Tax=Cylindrodendrum hubeiense TaxID=595255 RepID=A0A9P5H5P3_9HYPO|nr:hypothetical protein G7Z17_g11163 [Cylindrodendrum hubeiense]
MARRLPLFSILLLLLQSSVRAAETVSISAAIDEGHDCISQCLYYTLVSDMGEAMGCDNPYENNCYCATQAASATIADDWMSKCASSKCGKGDLTLDLSSMQSIYGSYCMGAGFTQPGATNWYNPAEATTEPEPSSTGSSDSSSESDSVDAEPSSTVDSGSVATTTQLTIVTQTTEGGAGATKSWVTVQQTTTVLVDSSGRPVSLDINDSDDSSSIKIGVGVAVPVVAILGGALLWWFWRKRRNNAKFAPGTQPSEEAGTSDTSTAPPPMSVAPVVRKPVGSSTVSPVSAAASPLSKTTELSGDGVQRELGGQEIKPFPTVTPSPPIAVPGHHEVRGDTAWRPEMDGESPRVEVSGEGRPPELHGQSQSPPPGYTHAIQDQQAQRWELPDNSRH